MSRWRPGRRCSRRPCEGVTDAIALSSGKSVAPPRPQPPLFHTIDGLRGVAVLAILLYHCLGEHVLRILPGVYFVVDMFYAISGFVLSYAYEGELRRGLGGWGFMRLRLIRVYPLYLLSLAIAVGALLAMMGRSGISEPLQFAASLVASALLLPIIPRLSWHGHHPYPFNGTTWTLWWELVINVVWSTLGPRLTNRLLAVFVVIGIALLGLGLSLPTKLEGGGAFETFHVGALRVVYSFFAGVAAYRLWAAGKFRWVRLPWWASILAMLAFMSMRPAHGSPAFDLIAVLAMPALVFASAGPAPRWLAPLCNFAGRSAYGIYILNFPILLALNFTLHRFGLSVTGLGVPGVALYIAVTIAIAAVAERYYDLPARRWLARRFAPRRERREIHPSAGLDGAA